MAVRMIYMVTAAVAVTYFFRPATVQPLSLTITVAFPNFTANGQSYYRVHDTVELAFKDVQRWKSKGRMTGLDGYELVPRYVSTYPVPGHPKFTTGAAVKLVVDELGKQRAVALMGERSSTVPIAEATALYNLPLINPIFTADSLFDNDVFPHVVNARSSVASFAEPMLQLMNKYKWERVAIIKDTWPTLHTSADVMASKLKARNHTILTLITFTEDRAELAVDRVWRSGARIIFAYVRPGPHIAHLMCQAYLHKIYGEGYVWFLQNWHDTNLHDNLEDIPTNCTTEEIINAANNSLSLWFLAPSEKNTLTGQDPLDIIRQTGPLNYFSMLLSAYDAVWTAALAFNKTLPTFTRKRIETILNDTGYTETDLTTAFLRAVSDVEFDGATGRVRYGKEHNRVASAEVVKYIDGERVRVATYSHHTKTFRWIFGERYIWNGYGGNPPLDRHQASHILINQLCVYVYWGVAGTSTLFAVVYFILVLADKNKIMPGLSCVTALGAILVNANVVLQSLDVREVQESMMKTICLSRMWLAPLAVSLFFGSMTIKSFAVYKTWSQEQQMFSGWRLFAAQLMLLLLDLAVLVPWQLVDPVVAKDQIITSTDPHVLPQHVSICSSAYITYWMMGVFCTKGLLIAAGAFIVWPAWIVSLKNGSTDLVPIGVSMYLFITFYVAAVPIAYMVPVHFMTIKYAFEGGSKLVPVLLATIILCFSKGASCRKDAKETTKNGVSSINSLFGFMSTLQDTKNKQEVDNM